MALDRLTFQQAFDIFRNEFIARVGLDFAFAPFSEEDAMAGGVGVINEALQNYVEDTFRRVWTGGAEGSELNTLALDRWRLVRVPASVARGALELSRPSVTPGAETIAAGDQFETFPDAEGNIKTVQTTVEAIMTGLTATLQIESTVADRGGNSAAGTFDSTGTPIAKKSTPFLDATITFTQPAAIAGGAPEETDEEFRDRIRNFIRNRQRATVEAVTFAALSVGGVANATLTEDLTNAPGIFNMFIADPDGRSSAALIELVFSTLNDWRAAGVGANVLGATFKAVNAGSPVLVQFTFVDNVPNEDILVARAFALGVDYVNTLAAGETWFANMMEGAMRDADKDQIDRVKITDPAVDSVTTLDTEIMHIELGELRQV